MEYPYGKQDRDMRREPVCTRSALASGDKLDYIDSLLNEDIVCGGP